MTALTALPTQYGWLGMAAARFSRWKRRLSAARVTPHKQIDQASQVAVVDGTGRGEAGGGREGGIPAGSRPVERTRALAIVGAQ